MPMYRKSLTALLQCRQGAWDRESNYDFVRCGTKLLINNVTTVRMKEIDAQIVGHAIHPPFGIA